MLERVSKIIAKLDYLSLKISDKNVICLLDKLINELSSGSDDYKESRYAQLESERHVTKLEKSIDVILYDEGCKSDNIHHHVNSIVDFCKRLGIY